MYCDFYQLTERPFNVTPDPKFLYLNARYREAIASLNYGITQRKGFITLIGEAGTGKTTLLKRLLEDLDAKTKSVFIFNTNVTFEEILEYIFAEFDLPVHNGKKLYMLQRLNSFLLEELRGGSNVALLIDEAQDLEFSVLEDLRLLSNLETAKEKILQIVLSGQPELGQKLSNPVLRQLRQRIGINCRLLPLSRDEITEYIQFRLQAAGCPDLKLFSREAEDQIYHFSRGIPRLVNVVCDNALVIGYALGKKRIGADLISEAAADLLSVEPSAVGETVERSAAVATSAPAATPSRWRGRLGVIGLVLVAMVLGLLSVGRTMLQRRSDDEETAAAPRSRPALEVIRPGSEPQGAGIEAPLAAPGGSGANEVVAMAEEPPSVRPAAGGVEAPVVKVAVRPADTTLPKPESEPAAPLPGREAEPRTAEVGAPAAFGPRRVDVQREHAPLIEERVAAARAVPPPPAAPVPPAKSAEQVAVGQVARTTQGFRESDDEVLKGWQPRASEPQNADHGSGTTDDRAAEPPVAEVGGGPRLDGVLFARIVVHVGDSISGIAMRKYGQATYTILDLLKLANPELRDIDQISVGQMIRLPELSEGFPILDQGSRHYALLVFSSPHASRAAGLQRALSSRGFDAHVSGGSVGANKPVFRVVVSGFADRDEGAAVGKQLQKLFREDTQIAQLGE